MITPEQVSALKKFQTDPNLFFRKVLGREPEIYQERINQAIADNDRTAIKACHDVGKTWDLAGIILWFGSCFPYSKIITTAPTYNQVKNILWSEIRAAYSRSKYPLGGKMNLTEWQITPEGDWFAIGFTPRNELSGGEGQGSASSFQGFHAPHVLLVFDEATGVPTAIWNMAEGILTSASVKFVAIGNPTSSSSQFAKCFKSPEWTKMSLTCFDSPNLKVNGITDLAALEQEISIVSTMSDADAQARLRSYKVVKPHLLSLKWVVSMGLPRKWGVQHPLFVSKVLGQFPAESDGTLIPLATVEEAMRRVYWPKIGDRKVIGADIARFGSDASVLTGLHAKKYLGKKRFLKKGSTEVTGEIIQFHKEIGGADVIVVDETGVGGGVVDALNEWKRGELGNTTEIRGVQFGAACEADEDKEKFVNIKARMFRLLADDLKATDGLCLDSEDVFLEELPTILFGYDSKGRMFVESKDDYKKRTGRKSPDDADSLALANFGNYDEISAGSFGEEYSAGYAKPFAASLGAGRKW